MPRSVRIRTLEIAANALGGRRKLGNYLNASSSDLTAWLNGTSEPPSEIFLLALEAILDELDRGKLR